jgi:hypothetical protein
MYLTSLLVLKITRLQDNMKYQRSLELLKRKNKIITRV